MPEPSGKPPSHRVFNDLSVFRSPPGGGPVNEAVVQSLVDDFTARIARGEEPQLVDIIAAPAVDAPCQFDVGDGRHRLEACRRMNLAVRAEVRPGPFKPGEVNHIRVSSLLKRRKVDAFEVCEIVTTHHREMGFKTYKEAGESLGIPGPTLSSILCVKRIPEALRPKTEGLCPTVIRTIARAATIEHMTRLIDGAFHEGKPVSKEIVELLAKRLKEGNKRGARPKSLRGKEAGRRFEIAFEDGDTVEDLVRFLRELATKIHRYEGLPPENLAALFAA